VRVASVSVTGIAVSAWLPLDQYTDAFGDGLYVKPGAGATVAVEVTPDDVFNPAVTPTAYALGAPFTGVTANIAGQLPFAVKAVRLNQTVGATTSTLQAAVRGGI